MAGAARRALAGLTVALVMAGCGGSTEQLLHPARAQKSAVQPPRRPVTSPAPSAESVYLAKLGTEQTDLANAEQQIPTNPRTPAALAHSVTLLAGAVTRLADGLAAIKPPANVAGDHARLVTITHAYAAQLRRAARIALAPGGERLAGTLLIRATDQASQSFTITTTAIDSTLGASPS
jgi:hypothetical protein